MQTRKPKVKLNKLTANQNVQLLIVWTIFLGLIILIFNLIYKFIIKKIFIYILSKFGYEDVRTINNRNSLINNLNFTDANMQMNLENEFSKNFESSKFKVSVGIYYKNDILNIRKKNIIQLFFKLASIVDLFLFIQVDQDQDEKDFINLLETNKIFDNGLKKHRVLFCKNLETISSFARQLQANMHIDSNSENIEKLQNKVPNINVINFNDEKEFKECIENIEMVISK